MAEWFTSAWWLKAIWGRKFAKIIQTLATRNLSWPLFVSTLARGVAMSLDSNNDPSISGHPLAVETLLSQRDVVVHAARVVTCHPFQKVPLIKAVINGFLQTYQKYTSKRLWGTSARCSQSWGSLPVRPLELLRVLQRWPCTLNCISLLYRKKKTTYLRQSLSRGHGKWEIFNQIFSFGLQFLRSFFKVLGNFTGVWKAILFECLSFSNVIKFIYCFPNFLIFRRYLYQYCYRHWYRYSDIDIDINVEIGILFI